MLTKRAVIKSLRKEKDSSFSQEVSTDGKEGTFWRSCLLVGQEALRKQLPGVVTHALVEFSEV